MVRSESFSMPLVAQTIGVARGSEGSASAITARVTCEGLTATTSSAPRRASARSMVPRTLSGSARPGRYLGFSCLSESARATSGACAQTTVSWPLPPSTEASAVPQLPPPITAARMRPSCPVLQPQGQRGARKLQAHSAGVAMSDPPGTVRDMKAALQHVCRECGYRTAKWFGKCPGCSAFASVFEEAARPPLRAVVPIDQVPLEAGHRDRTGIGELDRALGGGLVPGAVVLLAGDPGIGKSTLLLSALDRLARPGRPVLYVSGEESLQQIRLRGERLGTLSPGLLLAADTDANAALDHARKLRPFVLAVDSIQTLALCGPERAAGSVTQVREVGHRLAGFAKETGTPVILVGHVTKEGSIAGPRVLEHLVDTVLFFEGDRSHAYRVLRAHKNRFGSTNEIGVFEMKSEGLVEVANPSALFLSERPRDAPGSAVVSVMNGSRPLLVEVQALVADSASGGSARRTAIGVDSGRVAVLTAVLERKLRMMLADKD